MQNLSRDDDVCLLVGQLYSLFSMTIPLNISTGTDEGPVTRRLCFAVVLWVFPFSCSCSQIVLMICCLFSVIVTAVVWAGSGVEGVSLWRLLACKLLYCPWCSYRALRAVLKVPVKYDIDITVLKLSEYSVCTPIHCPRRLGRCLCLATELSREVHRRQ